MDCIGKCCQYVAGNKLSLFKGFRMKINVNTAQLKATLATLAKEQEFTIETRTEPSGFRKTNNPMYGNCFKVSKIRVKLGTDLDYSNEIKFQQIREGKPVGFQAQAPVNGVNRIAGTPFASHANGTEYLVCMVLDSLDYHYEDDKGFILDKNEVHKFTPSKPVKPHTQEVAGIDKPIIWRTYKLSSIKQVFTVDLDLFNVDVA